MKLHSISIRKLKSDLKKFRVTVLTASKDGNEKWMKKASFTDGYNVANLHLRIPKRKMKSNGVVILNQNLSWVALMMKNCYLIKMNGI